MKTKFKSRTNLRKVRTFHELELEKARLHVELVRVEEALQSNYRHLKDQLTFKNIALRLIEEISMTTTVVSKAFAIGKDLIGSFRKKKKKRKERHEVVPANTDQVEPETDVIQPLSHH